MNATAMVATHKGGLEVLQKQNWPLPEVTGDKTLVRIEATGVSPVEARMLQGRFPGQPRFPFVPGFEIVGTVEAVGPAVRTIREGQRVAALLKIGGWASHMVLPESELIPVPDGVDAAEAVALVVNGVTAWQLLHRLARTRTGQTVLVQGAAGNVGFLLVQLAALAGANVIGTASAGKLETVRELGAVPINYRSENVTKRVREIAPSGVAAVFDHVGGRKGITESFHMLGPGGALISYGVTGEANNDKIPPWLPYLTISSQLLMWNILPNGRRTAFYFIFTEKRRKPEAFRSDLAEVLTLLAQQQIKVPIARRLALAEAPEALRLLESGAVSGKIVLLPEEK
jgi:NADPH:quinone reductase-like Zn-dependent oxidoreductase